MISNGSAKIAKRISIGLDFAGMAYFFLYLIWVFALGTQDLVPGLTDFFNLVNPFTTGGYALGLILLLHVAVQEGIPGKIIMTIPFAISFLMALPIMMVMQSNRDLLIYAPYIVIAMITLIVAIFRTYKARKSGEVDAAASQDQ